MSGSDWAEVPLGDLVSLAGKRAVVTGAAVGIGAAIAARLAEAGAAVVLTDLDEAGADTAAALAMRGLAASFQRCDITNTADLVAVADTAVAAGGLHIWVNNAGIYPTTGPVIDVSDEFLTRMFEVNARAQFAAAREAARRMSGGGAIVNLASIAGIRGGAGISAYSASKGAVIAMTRALGNELGPAGIRVNAIAPGIVDTPGVRAQMAPLKAQGLDIDAAIAANPLRIAGHPDHIARVCLFLVSDLSAFVNGVTLVADGGATA
jgi:2-deoxy-D-gluconate 3-dehydrogenase